MRFTLPLVTLSGIYARCDLSTDESECLPGQWQTTTTTGSEQVLPLDVHDPGNTPAKNIFNTIDHYLKQSSRSLHPNANYVYEAHHVGRDTTYFTYEDEQLNKKGWNAIALDESVGGGMYITWEGDLSACTNIRKTAKHSNQECTFDKANEYCDRHGGELFMPDEYFWHFYFDPMCKNKQIYANQNGATYSNGDYWINLRRHLKGDKMNFRTTSNVHMFNRLDSTNLYSGWDSNKRIVKEGAWANVYENVLDDYLSEEELVKVENHGKVLNSYSTTSQRAHAKAANEDNDAGNEASEHLNMQYLSTHFRDNGGVSQECMRMNCGGDEEVPVVRDVACFHNNIRPLCMMGNPMSHYNMYCPADLGINMCGDDVGMIAVATVLGKHILKADEHAFGEPDGLATENNLIKNLREFYATFPDGENAFHVPYMYINCYHNVADLTTFQRAKCEEAGVIYDGDNVLNARSCQCTCPAPLEFLDENALQKSNVETDGMRVKHCCKPGYRFENTDGFEHEITDLGRCGWSSCADEFADRQHHAFWDVEAHHVNNRRTWWAGKSHTDKVHGKCVRITCDTAPEFSEADFSTIAVANLKAAYQHGEEIEYICDPGYCGFYRRQCVVDDDAMTFSWTDSVGQCIAKRCNRPANHANGEVNVFEDRTTIKNGGKARYTCGFGFNQYRLDNGEVDETFSQQCRAMQDHTPCFGGDCCSIDLPPVVECKPVTCMNPCGVGTKVKKAQQKTIFDVNDSVECACPCGTWQRNDDCNSVCQVNADGKSGDFVHTDCGCDAATCHPAKPIPHGRLLKHGAEADFVPNVVTVSEVYNFVDRLEQKEFISYECDAGFELTFTNTGNAVTHNHQCNRQCYIPPEEGNCPLDHGYSSCSAILDPLMCYCKPIKCPAHTNDIYHEYVDAVEAGGEHWPVPGFNHIDVQCKDPYFSIDKGSSHNRLFCTVDGWTEPEPCHRLACVDPRSKFGAMFKNTDNADTKAFAHTMNLKHTCHSRDEYRDGDDNLIDAPRFANQNAGSKLNYNWPSDDITEGDHQLYVERGTGDKPANVLEGSMGRFYCKPGYKAYFHAQAARDMNNWEDVGQNFFDCECHEGNWRCSHVCLCDGYCNDEL